MGYSSQTGQVIFRQQAVQGTYQADTGTAGIAMPLRSGALGTNRELLIPDPEIGGNRDIQAAYLGTINNSGDYEFYARLSSLPSLLKACLGTSSSATATGVTTHTVTPADTAQLPFLSIEEKIGSNLETFQYVDGVVNTLHLEAEPSGYLMGTAGIIAAKRVTGATPTATPVWDATPLIVGTNITVTYNSVSMPAKSFSLDVNNNFQDDDFRLGSFFLGDLTPKRREVTASVAIRESSKDLWRQATLGTSAATVPTGVPTNSALVITCTSYENIPSSTPPTPFSLTITIPNFILKPYAWSPSGDDIIESTIEGQAIRPAIGTPICTVVVKNGTAAIA